MQYPNTKMADGMLSLSWNNHSSTFCQMLSVLREQEKYTDVTVACDGKFYRAHKLVLSTCSDYFMKMLEETSCKHPVIILRDVNSKEMEALLSYMYAGIVSVAQNDLAELIKIAELLKIKGLAVPDEPPTDTKLLKKMRPFVDDRSSPHTKRHKQRENEVKDDVPSTKRDDRPAPASRQGEQKEDATKAVAQPPPTTSTPSPEKSAAAPPDNEDDDSEEIQIDIEVRGQMNERLSPRTEAGDSSNAQGMSSQVEHMVEEPLIKEELLVSDDSNDDASYDYSNLVPEVDINGVDGGGVAQEVITNYSVPPRYDHISSNDMYGQRPFQHLDSSSDIHARHLMFQRHWAGIGDSNNEEASNTQGYNMKNQNMPETSQLECQPHHPLVSLITDGQQMNDENTAADGNSHSPLDTSSQFHSHMFPFPDSDIHMSPLGTHPGKRDKKPYACAQCNYRTASKSNLIIHMRTHTGERPYSCPHCSFSASFEYNLKVHMRTHTGEKPFVCPRCPLKFAQKSHLKNHLYTHTGEKPFACQYCSARFSRRCNLRRHTRTHE